MKQEQAFAFNAGSERGHISPTNQSCPCRMELEERTNLYAVWVKEELGM